MCSHVTLFEEYLLLKDFEIQENDLTSKLEHKTQERTDMQEKVNTHPYLFDFL